MFRATPISLCIMQINNFSFNNKKVFYRRLYSYQLCSWNLSSIYSNINQLVANQPTYVDQLLTTHNLVQISSTRRSYHQSYYFCSQILDLLAVDKSSSNFSFWSHVYNYTFTSASKNPLVSLVASYLNKVWFETFIFSKALTFNKFAYSGSWSTSIIHNVLPHLVPLMNSLNYSSLYLQAQKYYAYQRTLLDWQQLNQTIFKVNHLSLCLRFSFNNIFLTLIDQKGLTLWSCSAGNLGLKGKQRQTPEALRSILKALTLFFRQKNVLGLFILRSFIIRSAESWSVKYLLNFLRKENLFFQYLIYDLREPHGYMRLPKPRRL